MNNFSYKNNVNKISVFDICETLYNTNTTFSFIDYHIIKNTYRYKVLSFLKLKVVKIFLVCFGKILKKDLYRMMYIMLLKGFTEEELKLSAEKYLKDVLVHCKIEESFLIMDKLKKISSIILCSASLDVICESICSNVGASGFFSSKLEFIDGVCSGRLKEDLLGRKDLLFEKVYWVVTDNKSDLNLIRKSMNYTVLSKKNNLSFWNRNHIHVDIIR